MHSRWKERASCVGEDRESRNFLTLLVGIRTNAIALENSLAALEEVKHKVAQLPAIFWELTYEKRIQVVINTHIS